MICRVAGQVLQSTDNTYMKHPGKMVSRNRMIFWEEKCLVAIACKILLHVLHNNRITRALLYDASLHCFVVHFLPHLPLYLHLTE